eukprot:9591557-Lingulodinium_polyedra.AAC.1
MDTERRWRAPEEHGVLELIKKAEPVRGARLPEFVFPLRQLNGERAEWLEQRLDVEGVDQI